MAIRYEALTQPSAQDLAVIGDIYETNFPPEEKVPLEWVLNITKDASIPTIVARIDPDNTVVGVIWAYRLGEAPYYFIPYFAVDKPWHGQGIGSGLLRHMVTHLSQFDHAQTLLWEVEPPESDPEHPQNRRIRFYERNGAAIVRYSTPYAMPDMTDKTKQGIVPMRIMFINVGHHELPNDKQQGYAWIKAIYDDDYTSYPHLKERVLDAIKAME